MGLHFHVHLPHFRVPHIDVGKALSTIEHDVGRDMGKLGHDLKTVEKDLGKLANKVERALSEGAAFIARELGVGLSLAEQILTAMALAIGQTVLVLRPLRPNEIQTAQPVFLGTLPLNRVLISPLSGASSRPFTVPGTLIMTVMYTSGFLIPGVNSVLLGAALLESLYDKYVIFLGPQGYRNALNHPFDTESEFPYPGQTFIHELTHVWQGHNQAFPWDYVYHSIVNQCMMGTSAYSYNVTNQPAWNSLHVEAQARVVQNWFANGSPTYGTLYAYVVSNIQAASPNGPTQFIYPPPAGQSDPGLVDTG
jgi:hypothetical protein